MPGSPEMRRMMQEQAAHDAYKAEQAAKGAASVEEKKYPREQFREEIALEPSASAESGMEAGAVEAYQADFESQNHDVAVNDYLSELMASQQATPEESRAFAQNPDARAIMSKYVAMAEGHMAQRVAKGESKAAVAADLDKKMRDKAFAMVLKEVAMARNEQRKAA